MGACARSCAPFILKGDTVVTVNVKPVPEILIKLKDREYVCSFNMLAMANVQEALGTLEGEEHISNISPAHMCALMLYGGIKANDDSFTMPEAKALAMQMGPGTYGEILGMFNDAVSDSLNEKDKNTLKKILAQKIYGSKKSI